MKGLGGLSTMSPTSMKSLLPEVTGPKHSFPNNLFTLANWRRTGYIPQHEGPAHPNLNPNPSPALGPNPQAQSRTSALHCNRT